MVMLIQVLAGVLLVIGSGLIFRALFEMERGPRPEGKAAKVKA